MTRSLPQSIQLLLMLAVLGVLIAGQQLFSLPGGSALWRAIQDSLHAPWFFCVVLVLCWWFRHRSWLLRLVIVGGIALLLALGTEYAQSFVAERSASRGDLVRNLVGGTIGFVFASAVFHSAKDAPLLRLNAMSLSVGAAALVALGVYTAWQPWQEFELRRYRAALLPQVIDLGDDRAKRYFHANEGGIIRFGVASQQWAAFEGQPVARLTFGDSEYPTFYINEVMQRWASFEHLALDLFVLGDAVLPITVAVQYEGSAGTSAFHEASLAPGSHRWEIPRVNFVPDSATGLRVRDVLVYTHQKHAGRSILLGGIELR